MRITKRNTRAARRLYRVCLIDGLLDESRARLVVQRIVESRRHDGVGILAHFQRLVRLDRDRHTARVESVVPLPEELRHQLEADIARWFGRGMDAEFTENSDLIGGVRMRVGSHVYDGSVRGRLTAIEAGLSVRWCRGVRTHPPYR
jgi:F-type H+-transporting ATPase subunit delta